MGALAVLAALASYAAAAADRLGPVLGALGAAAFLLLALGLSLRLPVLVPWALAVLGTEYTAFLYLGGGGRLLPLYAGAFVFVAELAHWALEPRSAADDAASLGSASRPSC